MTLVWAALFSIVCFARTKYGTGALVCGVVVLSHWILDFVVHVPDLPLWPGGPKVGLGLWNQPAATIVVETLMFIAGIWIYEKTTRPKNMVGRASVWAYAIVLMGLYLGDATSPPPPNISVVAWMGLIGWLFVLWALWIDNNREVMPR